MNEKLETFKSYLKEIYPDKYELIIDNLNKKPQTFRINTLKAEKKLTLDKLQNQGFKISEGPFDNSYIIDKSENNIRLSETDQFINGEIYIQELSSMIPPILLNPQQGDSILDIAAAPGSKTTQLALLAENKATILAIEKNIRRLNILKQNIIEQKSEEISVIKGNGIKFDKRNPQFIEFFDKALIDAPCSSEGRFDLQNPKTIKYWFFNKRKEMSKIQKGLLISAYRMLKPGGTMVYSTCTFGMEENELIIDWLFSKIDDINLVEIGLELNNIQKGFTEYKGKNLNPELCKSIRIIPNELFGGFYLAKIKKNEH